MNVSPPTNQRLKELIQDHDLDLCQVEEVQDLMDETELDADEAVEIYEAM